MTQAPWLFPAPVRPSRFTASSARWRAYNIEAALDRIAPFGQQGRPVSPVLHFDFQTQLDGNKHGRLGAGRAGIYRRFYVKGLGRTPAAGNWNDAADVYHGSGHLTVASALRERLITAVANRRGLGDAIVPCQAVLFAKLSPAERAAVAEGKSSSNPAFAPADGSLMALSLKPANFARISNVVWAFDHFCMDPRHLGGLFLHFEANLHPPDARQGLSGAPAAIAEAMDAAFHRTFLNFLRFAAAGLAWTYTQNNFTLDGRYADLETPLFFGIPFAGTFRQVSADPAPYRYIGFECFEVVWYWRLFLKYLLAKLAFLASRQMLLIPPVQAFLRDVVRQIKKTFPPSHPLFQDRELQRKAASYMARELGLTRLHRPLLDVLAGQALARSLHGIDHPPPKNLDLRPIAELPAPFSPLPIEVTAPAFLDATPSPLARWFTQSLASLGRETDPAALHLALARTLRAKRMCGVLGKVR
jgi:hypothetical protein